MISQKTAGKLQNLKHQAGRFAWNVPGLNGREFLAVDFVRDILETMDPRQAQKAMELLRQIGRTDRCVKFSTNSRRSSEPS